MLEKIIDKYFMKKLADALIHRIKFTMLVDLRYIELKGKVEIYVNHVDERKRFEKYRKVYEIYRYDIISVIANFNEYERNFEKRINDVLKEV